MLEIRDLSVSVGDKQILNKVDLFIGSGKKIILMGPNGSGKSTVCKSLMGDPAYTMTSGKVLLDGEDITKLPPNEKSKKGLFMIFQEPQDVEGLNSLRFVRAAYQKMMGSASDFSQNLDSVVKKMNFDREILSRNLNTTSSGGEKKKLEVLQMLLFRPKYALVDEFDSGLDVDSLKSVSELINGSDSGFLIVTHNPAVFKYLNVDQVNIIKNGRIEASGGKEMAAKIEKDGFVWMD